VVNRESRVATLTRELREVQERQTATADILQIIASSPSDVRPVFDAVADRAMRLLDCWSVIVARFDGEYVQFGAARGALPDTEQFVRHRYQSMRPDRASLLGRSLLERTVVSSADAQAEPDPQLRDYARKRGLRAVLVVPLLRDDKVEGALVLTRAEPGLFAPREIELVQAFADQAVIAIQNARLFNGTKEALERQTATAEILNVIASSPTDTQPVFDVIARSATELCEGMNSGVYLLQDGLVHVAGHHNVSPEQLALAQTAFPTPPHRGIMSGRAILDRAVAHVPDIAADPECTAESIVKAGFRSVVAVPMLRNGEPIGAINVTREEARPFSDRQIELLRTFADQAVIAIENARLFNETKEALEQQKASADILGVISNSVADTQPVFDKILDSIGHLFGGEERLIFLVGEDGLLHLGAVHGVDRELARAIFPVPLEGTATEVAIRERRPLSYAGVFNDPDVPPGLREIARRRGENYSMMIAPMLWEDRAIGSIMVSRTSMEAFDEKERSLLRTFADQAVIAIQNARLFNETREALERQTATADILKVIASSPSDVQPVFEAIAERSNRLVGAHSTAVYRVINEVVELVAFTRVSPEADEVLQPAFPRPLADYPMFELVRGGEVIQIPDTESALGAKAGEPASHPARKCRRSNRSDQCNSQGDRDLCRTSCAAAAHLRRSGGDRNPERKVVRGS
jgi:GAF domain-containing protein